MIRNKLRISCNSNSSQPCPEGFCHCNAAKNIFFWKKNKKYHYFHVWIIGISKDEAASYLEQRYRYILTSSAWESQFLLILTSMWNFSFFAILSVQSYLVVMFICTSLMLRISNIFSCAHVLCVNPLQGNDCSRLLPILWGIWYFILEHWEIFIYSRYQSFVRCMVCKYFLLICSFSLPLFTWFSQMETLILMRSNLSIIPFDGSWFSCQVYKLFA